MKLLVKPIIVITILILSIATSGMSQENEAIPIKNIFKISITKPIVKQYFFGYERVISDHFSLNTQVGFLRKAFYLETLSEMNLSSIPYGIRTEKTPYGQYFPKRTPTDFGSQVNLEFRYYPYRFERTFFLGVRGGYRYVNFGNDLEINYRNSFGDRVSSKKIDTKQNSYYYGLTIGSNVILGEKTALEFYLLIGSQHIELINPESIEVIPSPSGPIYENFKNNHLNPVNKLHLEFGIYLGIG